MAVAHRAPPPQEGGGGLVVGRIGNADRIVRPDPPESVPDLAAEPLRGLGDRLARLTVSLKPQIGVSY